MNLHKCILTKNDCYKSNRYITPIGIVVHSTGCNNPYLKRYVQPDDGKLGKNMTNHWNMSKVGACVNAFIGLLNDGKTVATYQTLPWNMRPWGVGSGSKGSYNNSHIQFEICEDGLKDKKYFDKVYTEAVELCIYLCKKYNIKPQNIVCHSEACKLGYATNHADVMHWFPKHGKSMDTFRTDVAKGLQETTTTSAPKTETKTTATAKNKTSKPAVAKPTLKKGSKGDEVKKLQKDLNYVMKCNLAVDGDFGDGTLKQLKAFQKKYKLTVDGIYGTGSQSAMKKALK